MPNPLTLLAKGRRYSLFGDRSGASIRGPTHDLPGFKWDEPELVPCPPDNAPRIGGYKLTIRPDLPPDLVIKFEYYTCPVSGILIYYAFDARVGYFLRELRGANGKGTGTYFSDGG